MGSYRKPSDAYSRRPSDDERRTSMDTRNSWHEPPNRRASESFKDDRYRDRNRDEDREPRLRDSFRVPLPRLDTASGRVRHEYDTSHSISASPGLSASSDGGGHSQALSGFFKSLCELIAERSTLSIHRDTQDKVLKQRRMEYEKSMPKHSEFPSVPELQNKFRKRDMKQREELQSHWDKNQAEVDKISQHLADELIRALPLSDMKVRLKDSLTQFQNKDYEKKLETMAETSKLYQDDARKMQESYRKLQGSYKELQETSLEHKASFTEQLESVKMQLSQVQEQLSAERRSEVDTTYLEESLRSQLAEQRLKSKEDLENLQRTFKQELESMRRAHKSDLEQLRQELTAQQVSFQANQQADQEKGLQALKSEADALQHKIMPLLQDMHGFTGQSVRHDEDVLQFRKECDSRLGALEAQLQGIDFSRLDLPAFDELVEFYTFRWPDINNTISQLRQDVDSLHETATTRAQRTEAETSGESLIAENASLHTQMHEFQSNLNKAVAKKFDVMVDHVVRLAEEFNNQSQAHESRLQALEENSSKDSRLQLGTPDDASTQATIEKLDKSHAVLVEQIARAKDDIQSVNGELRDKTEFLTMSITNLDTQVNNLSTRSLAEMMLGQLELVYADPRRLTADMAQLNSNYNDLTERLDKFKADQAKLHEDLGKLRLDVDKCYQLVLGIVQTGPEDRPDNTTLGRKKRRIEDDAMNGHAST